MDRSYKRILAIFVLEIFLNLQNNQSLAFITASHSPDASQTQPPPPLNFDQTDASSISASFGDRSWTIHDPDDGTSLPCVKLQGRIQFKTNFFNPEETEWIAVPETALATGHCQSLWGDYQDIKLSWDEYQQINVFEPEDPVFNLQHTSYTSYSIYFGFATSWQSEFSDLSVSPSDFAFNSVTIVVEKDGDHLNSISISDFVEFVTPKNTTFSCSTIHFQSGELELTISDFRFQAFNIDEMDFDPVLKCDKDKPVGNKDKTVWEHLAHGMGWVFISFFALCVFGVILVLLVGGFNKRHDIMAIGYKFVRTNGENQSSDA